MDTAACDHFTKDPIDDLHLRESDEGTSMKLYHAAVEKLGKVLSNGRSVFTDFVESHGHSFGDAQRWLTSVYNDFLDKLKLDDEEGGGTESADEKNTDTLDKKSDDVVPKMRKDESDEDEGKSNEKPVVSELYAGLQEAYDKVSQATAMVLQKAYDKLKDFSKDSVRIADDSPETAQEVLSNMKVKATDTLQQAAAAAKKLAEQRLHDGDENPEVCPDDIKDSVDKHTSESLDFKEIVTNSSWKSPEKNEL
uniref:Protein vip1 n=1 Tax=Syphacia muris TaxID=451379 RepID=A0A0N5A875_9BILA